MAAEITFFGRIRFGIETNGLIRAGVQTGLTSIASVRVQGNRSVLALYQRFQGTRIHTRRLFAVLAQSGQKMHLQFRKPALRRILLWGVQSFNPYPSLGPLVF
jgi:hypothetical protein